MMRTLGFSLSITLAALVFGCGDDGGGKAGAGGTETEGTSTSGATVTTDGTAGGSSGGTANPGTDSGPDMGSGTDSGTAGSTGGTTGGEVFDTFRLTEINVRDPHFYVDNAILGCLDGTALVNQEFNNTMNVDGDGDGVVDLSFVLVFDPLDQNGSGDLDWIEADCSFPLVGTSCTATDMAAPAEGTYVSDASAACLTPTPAELTDMYAPDPNTAAAPCFLGAYDTVIIELGGVVLPLQNAQIAGTYDADPAGGLVTGIMRGFLSEADADAAMLPMSLMDSTGATVVSELFPGGAGNCASHSDLDDNGGTAGWWMYVDFAATGVTYQ